MDGDDEEMEEVFDEYGVAEVLPTLLLEKVPKKHWLLMASAISQKVRMALEGFSIDAPTT